VGGAYTQYAWKTSEMRTKVWSEILKGEQLEDLNVDATILLKCMLEKQSGRMWMVLDLIIYKWPSS
jgi:hypothetical protein